MLAVTALHRQLNRRRSVFEDFASHNKRPANAGLLLWLFLQGYCTILPDRFLEYLF